MDTNYYNQHEEERMMREEYGRDFGGCLWGLIAILVFLAAICAVILFASKPDNAMRTPKSVVVYDIKDGTRHRFASLREMERKIHVSDVYARRKLNTGSPCKGFLIYDPVHADTPEAIAKLRSLCKDFDQQVKAVEANIKANPERLVSVRVDSRTIIMVKASKRTPDYAERYRERMAASRPTARQHDAFIAAYDGIKPKKAKRGPGRPRKEARP